MILEMVKYKLHYCDYTYLKAPVITFVANMSDNVGSYVRVADDTHSVVLLTEASQCDPWLLATEHQVRVVLRHS